MLDGLYCFTVHIIIIIIDDGVGNIAVGLTIISSIVIFGSIDGIGCIAVSSIDFRRIAFRRIDFGSIDFGGIEFGSIDFGRIDFGRMERSRIRLHVLIKRYGKILFANNDIVKVEFIAGFFVVFLFQFIILYKCHVKTMRI